MAKVAVIGTGYVGLVAGACFADSGHEVIGVDRDPKKLASLRNGVMPIYEPGLDDIVTRNHAEGRLKFTDSIAEAVTVSDVIFLAVGTPPLPSGQPDLSQLEAASLSIGDALRSLPSGGSRRRKILVNKSTVPVGAHRMVADWVRTRSDYPIEVVSNPEFLKEGTAVEDFFRPDRVVIGAESDEAFEMMEELYRPFVRQGNPILRMDPISAELTKYACNAFLATRISFMNELSRLCDAVGGDIEVIRKGMSTDQRIGRHFLYAGVGYGGSCFPKDVEALLATAEAQSVPLRIIDAAQHANAAQKGRVFEILRQHFGAQGLKGRTIAFWGLAFKPNTDDMREAPAITIARELLAAGVERIQAFDPIATETAKREFARELPSEQLDRIRYCEQAMDAARGADALVLVTEWREFRNPDFALLKEALRAPVLVDGRNQYEPADVRALGFTYYGIGRGRAPLAAAPK